MIQLNGQRVTVTVVDANNFTIGVDTTGYPAYTSGGTAARVLYYSLAGDGAWRFTQFGSLGIAVNGIELPAEVRPRHRDRMDGSWRLLPSALSRRFATSC